LIYFAKPGVKRKQENVATKADKRKYEDKRDRCFQEHWLEKIPWLQHDAHLTLKATHLTFSFTFTIFLICLLYNIHWFCLFFLLILFITSLILINNCNLSLFLSDYHKDSSECEMSEEETFRSINRIIEYSDRICDSVVK
jgi:hypothetical protein